MGKKRNRENSEERIARKIRKLEEKLEKRHRRIIYSSEEEYDDPRQTGACDSSPKEHHAWSSNEVYALPLTPTPPAEEAPVPPTRSPTPGPAQPSTSQPATAAGSVQPTVPGDVQLDDEILQLLGDAPEPETTLGDPVHKDIAARWLDVLKKGLTKECKEKIFKEYLIPSNCDLLVPPILNPEAKVVLTDALIKRDASMVSRQKHLSVAVAALTHTLEKIFSNQYSQKLDVVKPISDACRILCDMHHYETETRKKFVISSANVASKDALANSTTDKFLFGENLYEKVKTAKIVQRSGEDLKNIQKTNNLKNTAYNRVNYRALHQKRPEAGRTQTGLRHQYAYPRSRTSGRAQHPHAPPPPPPPVPAQPPRGRRTDRRR